MCGIMGAIGERDVVPIVTEGLRRLEYRGYDSVGIAAVIKDNGNELRRIRVTGRVKMLAERIVDAADFIGQVSIGHTRWATHGRPCEKNAHPHFSRQIGVVHNGIIENHAELRGFLTARGYQFCSETDTEVIAHLIHHYSQMTEFTESVMLAVEKLRGQFAIGVINQTDPDRLVVARHGSPLVIGRGIGENFFASDVSALLPVTSKFVYLEDGDFAVIQRSGIKIFDRKRAPVQRPEVTTEMSSVSTDLGIFRHYMQKEIFEQPQAIEATLATVLEHGFKPELFGPDAASIFKELDHITILGCGTSHNSGLIAKTWIEEIAQVPVSVEIANEYSVRKVAVPKNTLVIAISQSGETADTIAAVAKAKQTGAKLLSICNVSESSLARISDMKFMTSAGPEIGVASTKAFTTQLVALRILAYCLAKARRVDFNEKQVLQEMRQLPYAVKLALAVEPQIHDWAKEIAKHDHAFFLGRGVFYPVAEEGSLKLKEISYIHAEAYPAGELKHGPLALIDDTMPVIMFIPDDELNKKNQSSMQEIVARSGQMFVLCQSNVEIPSGTVVNQIKVPTPEGPLDPIAAIIPLQLLAYHVAVMRGTDIDKPRNLAKSVTTL